MYRLPLKIGLDVLTRDDSDRWPSGLLLQERGSNLVLTNNVANATNLFHTSVGSLGQEERYVRDNPKPVSQHSIVACLAFQKSIHG